MKSLIFGLGGPNSIIRLKDRRPETYVICQASENLPIQGEIANVAEFTK